MYVRFGLYLIPQLSTFYEMGSAIVGYDIRFKQKVNQPKFIHPEWVSVNNQFGFHATLTDAITINEARLPEIINKTKELHACFKPNNQYILTKKRIGFWRKDSDIIVLLMKANRNIEMLHDVLVTGLHPLGSGSEYFEQYTYNRTSFTPNSPSALQKLQKFYSPYIFDEFIPHFTLINPYTGPTDKRSIIEQELDQQFKDIRGITFDTLTLVTQSVGSSHFQIAHEFSLHGDEAASF